MSNPREAFRPSQGEALESPEELDALLSTANARPWLALGAAWILLATVVGWAVFGTVSVVETGRGIIVSEPGAVQVFAPGAGRLTKVSVRVGDRVAADQELAVIDDRELGDELAIAELRLASLEERHRRLSAAERAERAVRRAGTDAEAERLEAAVRVHQQRVEELDLRLNPRGSVAETSAMNRQLTADELERARRELASAVMELDRARTAAALESARDERTITERELELEEARRLASSLRERRDARSSVRSPIAGRVAEVRASAFGQLDVGDPMFLIEPDGGRLQAVVFVSARTGKRVSADDEVVLAPANRGGVGRGTIRGRVERVAAMPSSAASMDAVLNDSNLVEQFVRDVGLPLEVRIDLLSDEGLDGRTVQEVSGGTLCTATIVLDRRAPLSMLLSGGGRGERDR